MPLPAALLATLLAAAATPQGAVEATLRPGQRAEVVAPALGTGAPCRPAAWEALRPTAASGRAALRFTGSDAAGRACEGFAWAQVTLLAPAPVATRPLADGDPLDGAVAWEEREVRPGRRAPAELPAGATAARRLSPGDVLDEAAVRAGPRLGDAVTVLLRVGALTVEQPGRALPCPRGRACALLPSGRRVEGRLAGGRILVELPMTRTTLFQAALLALLLTACGPAHVGSYKPKQRAVPVPESVAPGGEAASAGSLYRDGLAASNLYTDARALRENDLVVVRVEEIADARRSADTDLTHQSQTEAAISAFLQATQQSYSLTGKNNSTFHGNGATARTERLTATVPAVVKKVLANGNLFIEGHRVVLVNAEEQHFYISGVVRPIDIDQENSVKSSVVAEAEVEFTGRGVLTDNQRQGWLSQIFTWIWPF